MKKQILRIVIILTLWCCKEKEQAPANYVLLSGKIENKKSDLLVVKNLDLIITDTIKIQPDGSFNGKLTVSNGKYTINNGTTRIQVYLTKGDSISFSLNTNDKNTLNFSGKGFEASKYLFEKGKKVMSLFKEAKDMQDLYMLEESSFKNRVSEIKLSFENLLNNTKNVPDEFQKLEKRDIHYYYLELLKPYMYRHQYYTKNKDFKVSNNFLRELDDLSFNDERDFQFSENYRSIVSNHFHEKRNNLLMKDTTLQVQVAFNEVYKSLQNKVIRNNILFENVKYQIQKSGNLDSIYKSFMKVSESKIYKDELTKIYNKILVTAKGHPSPQFFNFENYEGGTTSLSDLKGTYLYVDIWATWCGPCKAEIPFLKKLEKKYQGKNIQFVSISVDKQKDKSKWKELIANEGLEGIQLITDNELTSKFIKDYGIESIPRFILLDPNTNIVSANAPRPSNKELVTLFNELGI